MNKSVYGLLAAATLVGAAAVPAHAAGDEGSASAAVLRADLKVSLLKGGAAVPLNIELNAVRAPESAEKAGEAEKAGKAGKAEKAEKKALTVTLDGAHGGEPIRMLRADVATAKATVEKGRAEGYSNLTNAEVYVPGLSWKRKPLVGVDLVTSRAVCEAGADPMAKSELPGTVTVLGKEVAVKAEGTTTVEVDGLGTVELKLAETRVTSDTAAATALALDVALDPAALGVAEIEGRVALVEASCETPGTDGSTGGSTGGSTDGGATDGGSTDGGATDGGSTDGGATGGNGGSGDGGATGGGSTTGDTGSSGGDTGSSGGANEPKPQTGSDGSDTEPAGNLAETGGNSATPYIAGGALALVAAGGALVLLRRRRAAGAADA